MKILHTADIHLNEDNNERWEALLRILGLGTKESIDAMAVSGDLFDANIDALKLKTKLRGILSDLPFDIYVIPGNHDSRAFEDRAFFGSNIKVINSPGDVFKIGDVVVTGLPFRNTREEELYSILRDISARLDDSGVNLLLYHGELLDSFFSRKDFGEEGDARYMPSRLDFFNDLNFDYVLAGHFHTNFNIWEFEKNNGTGYFVYPGSPVSVTRRETGKRKVNIFETGESPRELVIDTEYFESVIVKLDPSGDLDPQTAVEEKLDAIDGNAKIILRVEGYMNSAKHGVDETALNDFLNSLKPGKRIIETEFNAVDLRIIFEDTVFRSFNEKLGSADCPENLKADARDYLIKAMTESLS